MSRTTKIKTPAELAAAGKREDGKVWIEGVPVLAWGKGVECTYAGALAAALTVTEQPCAYDDIMGWSGLAFRTRWFHAKEGRGWCPSSPVGEVTQAMEAVDRASGWRFRHEWHSDDPKMERFGPDIVAAVDSGRPILAYDEGLNVAVIVGYTDGGKTVLLRGYGTGRQPRAVPASKLGPMLMFLRDHVAPLAPREAFVAGLKIAVGNWRRQVERVEKGSYWYGDEAFAKWASDLDDTAGLTEDQRTRLFFVSWRNFSSLADARSAAAKFLRNRAGLLGPDARGALLRAATLYEQQGSRLGEVLGRKDAFLGPWSGKKIEDWSPAVRQREVQVLAEARMTEAQAIAEIEQALAAEGVKVEAPATGAGGTSVATTASAKRLDGLKMVPFWMSHVGGLVSCAEYLKVEASRAWIYGGCGHAFALNICEVPCPSGPTAWPAEKCDALAANVGLKVASFNAYKNAPDFVQARDAVWRKTRGALDAGHPCFGWNMEYPEWFPICGYDADGNYLFLLPDNSISKRHNTKLGDTDIGVACVLAVSVCPPADDRTVVRQAARFALEHAAGKHSRARWRTGLPAYDRWMTWLQDETLYAKDGAGMGQAFNAQCWAECRRHAVAFLEEAKKRLSDGDLVPHFDEAIGQYRAVSTSLDAVAKSFPETMGNAKAMDERMRDAERRAEALKSLAAAREAEVAGLKPLARLAVALGAKDVNPDAVGTPAWIALPSLPGRAGSP